MTVSQVALPKTTVGYFLSGLPVVREKKFKVNEKSGNFTKSQGIWGFIGKVMEKSGNFVDLFL